MATPRKPAKEKRAPKDRPRKRDGVDGPAPRALIKPAHGHGQLRVGGTNRGGTGRPPSEVRDALLKSFEDRIPILERIADGEPTEIQRVRIDDLLPYVSCPQCGEGLLLHGGDKTVEVTVHTSAKAEERRKAIETMAKYGLGNANGVPLERVREGVKNTIAVLREMLPPETLARVLPRVQEAWT